MEEMKSWCKGYKMGEDTLKNDRERESEKEKKRQLTSAMNMCPSGANPNESGETAPF